jgi:hypothetical protein
METGIGMALMGGMHFGQSLSDRVLVSVYCASSRCGIAGALMGKPTRHDV